MSMTKPEAMIAMLAMSNSFKARLAATVTDVISEQQAAGAVACCVSAVIGAECLLMSAFMTSEMISRADFAEMARKAWDLAQQKNSAAQTGAVQ